MKYAKLENDGAVSIVTLNRPERLNAISGELLDDLHQALVLAQADSHTRVIVLTGAGRAFCAGDDLKEFGAQTQSQAAIERTCEHIQRITRDIMFGPKLVVGAVHGYAVGGGFEWMLNCDMVVAAEDLVCFFPEMQLGHFVTGAVTHLLPQAVGRQRAVELIVMGERQNARALQQLGLVNQVVASGELMAAAMSLAHQAAQRSFRATSDLKRVLLSQSHAQLAAALDQEQRAAMEGFADEETSRRIEAFTSRRL